MMQYWPIQREIRYEKDLDPEFVKEMIQTPGGEQLAHCIQCGTCSATCPLSIYMDYTPRRIIAMTRAGLKDDVLGSFTLWLCVSCYSCSVECPRNIKITDLMYALKQRAIAEGTYPKRFAIPVLAREFFNLVKKQGRNNEARVIVRLFLKTNPLRSLKKIRLGANLFRMGRLSLKNEKIERREELARIIHSIHGGAAAGGDVVVATEAT